jgi:methylmalonyl-CoA mutase
MSAVSAPDDSISRPLDPAREFPPVSVGDWQRTAAESLGGRQLADLVVEVCAGVTMRPLAAADDLPAGVAAAIGRAAPRWLACQRCDHPDPAEAARWIADAAGRDAGGAWLVLDAAARRGLDAWDAAAAHLAVDGVSLSTAAELEPVLRAIDAGNVEAHLDGGGNGLAFAAAVLAARQLGGGAPGGLAGGLGWDPLGALAGDGELGYGLQRSLELLTDAAAWAGRHGPGLRAVSVSTLPYHLAGATPVQELACAVGTGVEYLRRMTAAGVELETACRGLVFVVPVGRDLPAGIATLRALRLMWARVVEVAGGGETARPATIHAVTPPRGLTRRDPWVNMLRGTVGAFAAVAGGADILTVLPFDAALGHPDAFGRRIAASLHAILREESHFGRVLDPAGGSYAIERLTHDLAEAAWAAFQTIEGAGGMAAALLDGSPQREIAESARRQAEQIADGRMPITGVSSHPDRGERPLERPVTARSEVVAAATARRGPSAAGAKLGELLAAVERAAAAAGGDGSVLEAAIAAMAAGATLGAVAAAIRGRGEPTAIAPFPAAREEEVFERLRSADRSPDPEPEAGRG